MNNVARKTEAGEIDGTPEKRLFWSIISDYDLLTGLCELVDNAIDIWSKHGKRKNLEVGIHLDSQRQLISVTDNAGGVDEGSLRLLIVPGGSSNDPNSSSIGIFGVGSKRASIALGEEVTIKTRRSQGPSHQIDITKSWLEDNSWEIPVYTIPSIKRGTTTVDISRLRSPFDVASIEDIKLRLGEIYGKFLQQSFSLKVNECPINFQTFERWAFPPEHQPQRLLQKIELSPNQSVTVDITGGLTLDREPEKENYGVYFYCNDRLIVKELRTREVGYFVTAEAGVPHPDASLCRVIVKLEGAAQAMPWTSNKTGINYSHPLFQKIQADIRTLVSHFSKLSRRTKTDWQHQVFSFTKGEVTTTRRDSSTSDTSLLLPNLPKTRKLQSEKTKQKNRRQILEQPWTLGLVEGMSLVDIVTRQKLDTKNRAALLLLDSNFEIALKEFIVNREDLYPRSQFNDAAIKKLFSQRNNVVAEIGKHVTIPKKTLDRISYYYKLRNKLIHERATVDITDTDIANFRKAVEQVLKILFDLKF